MTPSSRRLFPLFLILGLAGQGLVDSLLLERAVLAQAVSRVSLKLRKEPRHLDVMLTGIGDSARVVQERSTDTNWRGEITGSDEGLSTDKVAQQVSMPEMGLASVRLRGSGSAYRLEVKSVSGTVLPKPKILATGNDLVLRFSGLTGASKTRQTGSLDLRRPGRVAQPVVAPPMRSRAVAPPLGDMAVGTMLMNNRSFVKASGPPVSLTLNNAPAKDALMSLARLGGYGFVFVGQHADANSSEEDVDRNGDYPVTMAFKSERYDRALNSVLMASGLQGRLDGGILLVGTAVSAQSFGPQMSKVFRLNQVDVESASQYLGNLGAVIQIANTSTTTSRESESSGTNSNSSESSSSTTSESSVVDTYGASFGPLLGLIGTTDARLNTITLVGDPSLISVAQSYLRQIDLRKRQVAVKVLILNVSLDNDASIDSSFSAKIGNTFIVSQSGKAHMNFGAYKPGGPLLGAGTYNGSEYIRPGTYPSFVPRVQAQDARKPVIAAKDIENGVVTPIFDDNGNQIGSEVTYPDLLDERGRPVYIPDSNPNAAKQLVPKIDRNGRPIYVKDRDPNSFKYPDNSFYSYLESVVVSSSSKILAQPTLLVQEGENAVVRSGQSVITGVSKSEGANGSTSFSNSRADAGLTLNLEVEKIDDNGFVTLNLNPVISVPVSAGVQEGVQISDIVSRELDSGRIRLRDRQTLILTGVIQESDRKLARKWPILGDLPLVGQLFRSSTSKRQKSELVIIVTPSVLDDDNGGSYGYGYRPGTPAGRELVQQGY